MIKHSEPGGGDEFEAIIAGIDDQRDVESRRGLYFDAGIREFLDSCRYIQNTMAEGIAVDTDQTTFTMTTLWNKMVGEGVPFTLTAKVTNDFDYPTPETVQPASDLVAVRVVLEDFMISDGVVAMVVESTDDGSGDCLTVYLDDIQFIELDKPTNQERAAILRQSYPQIYAKLEQIPSESENDQEIIGYLRSLHLDLTSGTDSLATTTEKFIYSLTDLLNQHLIFDSAPYTIEINGQIIGRDYDQDLLRFDFAGQLPNTTVHQIEIVGPDPGSDSTESEIVLTVTYPVAGVRNGVTTLFLPVDSITGLASTRPLNNPLANLSKLETLIERLGSQTGTIDAPINQGIPQVAPLTEASEEVASDFEARYLENLETYQAQLSRMFAIVNDFENRVFTDGASAEAAIGDMIKLIDRLGVDFDGNPYSVRVQAVGVRANSIDAKLSGDPPDDASETTVNLTLHRQTVDKLSDLTGYFSSNWISEIREQGDGSYRLAVYVGLRSTAMSGSFSSDDVGVFSFASVSHVPVDENFLFELTGLANLKRFAVAEADIKDYSRQNPILADLLEQLLEFVRTDTNTEYSNVDPDIIQGILRNTADNPESIERTSELLSTIIGNRNVFIEQLPSGNEPGLGKQPLQLSGPLIHVLPTNPATHSQAIHLVVDSGENDLRYVDLSDVTILAI